MNCTYYLSINGTEIHKKSTIPFLPAIDMEMWIGDAEHVVMRVFWSDNDQTLDITLDPYENMAEKEAEKELALWLKDGWLKE